MHEISAVVGIGCSAGGQEALRSFLEHLPDDFKFPIVVVMHLSAQGPSYLKEILDRFTHLPVVQIEDGMEIKPATVFVIPPGFNLLINRHLFRLEDRPPREILNLPINLFFESLAAAWSNRAAGIILTGMGSDGKKGIQTLKSLGGLTLAQDPASASFESMPLSAIETGQVDMVSHPWEMPAQLIHHFKDPISFINPLVLHTEKAELIQSETFFEDEAFWHLFSNIIIPRLFSVKRDGQTVRFWVSRCGSGELAYTLGMIVDAALQQLGRQLDVEIIATEQDRRLLERAADGLYHPTRVDHLPPEQVKRYFIRHAEHVGVAQPLRRLVTFAHHNALVDPPFGEVDCLIYNHTSNQLEPGLGTKLVERFQYGLNSIGLLILKGELDLPPSLRSAFEEVDLDHRIYQNKKQNAHHASDMIMPILSALPNLKEVTLSSSTELPKVMSQLLLDELKIATYLIDANGTLQYAAGPYKEYFHHSDALSLSLIKMLPNLISSALLRGIELVKSTSSRFAQRDIPIKKPNENQQMVHLFVEPFYAPSSENMQFLVCILPQAL